MPSYFRVVRELQPRAVIFGMGPDVRWVGTESGIARETEWSVVPVGIRDLVEAKGGPANASGADGPGQIRPPLSLDDLFVSADMTAADLGSRERIASARALAWYPAEADVSIRPGWFYHAKEDGEVKSPEKLLDIYFGSVGRNAVLLLNVPPDRRGRISDSDARSLLGLRRILDETFQTNLAAGAAVKASSAARGHQAAAVLDGDKKSYWQAAPGAESAAIAFDLGEERAFDVAMLQENIRVGQRIEGFSLEAWKGAGWVPLAQGTTIGYKRLLRFPVASARKVRLVISKSRTEPTLAAFGLFRLHLQP